MDRMRVALVLGSGGARGYAHIGVIAFCFNYNLTVSLGPEHKDTHDRFSIHPFFIAYYGYMGIEFIGNLNENCRGPRMQALLIFHYKFFPYYVHSK